MRTIRFALLTLLLIAGGCVHHSITLQLVDSTQTPVADVDVSLQSGDASHAIGPSHADGHVATFTAQPKDEIKLKKEGFRDTRLVIRSREIEVYRSHKATTNPIANIIASFLADNILDDTIPIVKGQPIIIQLKEGRASQQLFGDGVHGVFMQAVENSIGEQLRRDMVHACIQIYPWKVQFPFVESEPSEVKISVP